MTCQLRYSKDIDTNRHFVDNFKRILINKAEKKRFAANTQLQFNSFLFRQGFTFGSFSSAD